VYAATINGQRLMFETVGVWRRNMIVRDRETKTLWQHATGAALIGPLKGQTLHALGGEMLTWAAWKADYPHSTLSLNDGTTRGLLPMSIVDYLLRTVTEHVTPPGLITDKRLPAHAWVVGIVVAGEAKAYSLDALMARPIIDDRVGGKRIKLTFDPLQDRVGVFDVSGKAPMLMSHSRQRWMGWSEFHPGTALWSHTLQA
jgi:hypothetical protein